jgi:hypothetical protein
MEFPMQLELPTTQYADACRGVGFDGTVRGDPADPRIVWVETENHGTKRLVWPAGYVARFDPALEVIDISGQVVVREGDRVSGGCVKGPPDDPGSIVLIRGSDRLEPG